ncbi:uncharacterized protein LOC135922392 [Gordionus sp. m RMFG-2023]|uniref:uncharacterized protein LOC135922392 n=1 Tax=Gordionus sp. m RMFG-2023 TaxID=3053472 RepID=UPI0031FDA454
MKKIIPTHFISIHIDNCEIIANIKQVQNLFVLHDKNLENALIQLEKIHLTLLLLNINANIENRVARIFDFISQEFSPDLSLFRIKLKGLGNFGNKVILLHCDKSDKQNYEMLLRVKSEITLLLLSVGFTFVNDILIAPVDELLDDMLSIKCHVRRDENAFDVDTIQKNFTPHATILKLSKLKGITAKSIKKLDPKIYNEIFDENYEFGEQIVDKIYLSCIFNKKIDKNADCDNEMKSFKIGYFRNLGAITLGKTRVHTGDNIIKRSS